MRSGDPGAVRPPAWRPPQESGYSCRDVCELRKLSELTQLPYKFLDPLGMRFMKRSPTKLLNVAGQRSLFITAGKSKEN
jgi:hypothetical protein